jgi:3-hydroxy-D-aspartate aldolase
VLADDVRQVRLLSAAAVEAGVELDVLVEVDLGMRRCGVPPDSDALIDVATAVAGAARLRFAGIQAYEGHVAGIADPAARRAALDTAAGLLRRAIERVTAAGLAVETVGGGSTGTLPYLAPHGLWNDIQAGSYLLMDGVYSAFPDLPFEPALFALATVIHRSESWFVLDGGLKQLSVDRGMPAWLGDPAATLRLSDEHTVVRDSSAALPDVGERTLLQPRHIDPTINLHPTLWLYEGDTVAPVAVDGRMGGG